MRPLLLILAFLATVPSLMGQGPQYLWDALGRSGLDTGRVRMLLQLSEAVNEDFPDSALNWSGQALGMSRRLNHTPGLARAHLAQAAAHLELGNPDAAATALRLARTDFAQLRDPGGELRCLLLDARLAASREDFAAALRFCLRADSILADTALPALAPEIPWLRGDIYRELFLHAERALPAYRTALGLEEKGEYTKIRLARLYGRLGEVFEELGQADSAAFYHGRAAETWEEIGAPYERLMALATAIRSAIPTQDTNLIDGLMVTGMRAVPLDTGSQARGVLLGAQGQGLLFMAQADSAMKLYRRALAIQRRGATPAEISATRLGIASVYLARLDYSGALRHADSAMALADTLSDPQMQMDASALLYRIYTLAGDARNALRYSFRFESAEDAIARKREARLRLAAFTLEDEAKALAAEASKVEVAKGGATSAFAQNRIQMIFLGGLGLLFLLFLFALISVIRRGRRIRRLQAEVREQTEAADSAYEDLARMEQRMSRNNSNLEQLVDERTEQLKTAVAGLVDANEALDTFIYRASHDLLAPLARLKGLVLLARNSQIEQELATYIDLISAVSVYMDRVLRKLILVRDLQAPVQGKRPVNVVEMIQLIEPSLRELPGITSPNISVEDHIRKPILVDERNLRIVLENLLENACIFRKDSQTGTPHIDITLRRHAKGIHIEIVDQGIGIADEIRERVFDIFFRGSERSKGNGLGLFLVKRAVEGLNGVIAVESKAGAFTKIAILFPEG